MSMKIRLARGGSKKRPHYAIVATDSRMPRDGRFLEKLGTYNPMLERGHADRAAGMAAGIAEHCLHQLGRAVRDLGLVGEIGGRRNERAKLYDPLDPRQIAAQRGLDLRDHPLPEPEHVRRVDAELRDLAGVGRPRDEMAPPRLLVAQGRQAPGARAARVGERLQGGEGLRADDEQRLGGVEVAGGLGEVGAVDVRDEAERHRPVAVVLQRFIGHDRTQIGTADAYVDHVANALSGVPLPLSVANAVAEAGHSVQYTVNLRDHIVAIDEDGGTLWRSQRHMQNRSLLRDVDLLASEHGINARLQP